ncbi:MAG: tRNA pseudouridine(55) synthase TruB [Verrucomicrobiales bacterium]|nr:tRNA pseudouridine(55) synthase TruB [Verrucomicrobiales bacterium]
MLTSFDSLDGALLVDKPAGITSHDVVDRLRRHLAIKKVGHCGTLDPMATGLLVILLGRATKLSDTLMAADKVYTGRVKFGETTDSYDADGEIQTTLPVMPMELPALNEAAAEFCGDLMQAPPMVSAVKIKGVPLYKLARKGIEVPREPRLVHVYSFKFQSYSEPFGDFRLACTKGTYVRSIAHDLGQKLGCGAHLVALRRTESGRLSVDQALPMDDLIALPPASLEARVVSIPKLAGA